MMRTTSIQEEFEIKFQSFLNNIPKIIQDTAQTNFSADTSCQLDKNIGLNLTGLAIRISRIQTSIYARFNGILSELNFHVMKDKCIIDFIFIKTDTKSGTFGTTQFPSAAIEVDFATYQLNLLPKANSVIKTPTKPSKITDKDFEREFNLLAAAEPKKASQHKIALISVHGHFALKMDKKRGHPLSDWLRKNDLKNQLTESLLIQIGLATLIRIQKMHGRGIIHRDLKPANIMLYIEGDEVIVKLIDFGLAKWKHENRIKEDVGTHDYICPQTYLNENRTEASDIFSAGIIFIEVFFHGTLGVFDMYQKIVDKLIQLNEYTQHNFYDDLDTEIENFIKTLPNTQGPLLSPLLKNLITDMLKARVDQRITLDEALERMNQLLILPELEQVDKRITLDQALERMNQLRILLELEQIKESVKTAIQQYQSSVETHQKTTFTYTSELFHSVTRGDNIKHIYALMDRATTPQELKNAIEIYVRNQDTSHQFQCGIFLGRSLLRDKILAALHNIPTNKQESPAPTLPTYGRHANN